MPVFLPERSSDLEDQKKFTRISSHSEELSGAKFEDEKKPSEFFDYDFSVYRYFLISARQNGA
jgi:hypothetical protein